MRKSSYTIYPGNLQILSRYVGYRKTIPFQYGNQLETTTLNHPHYGRPRLQMSWQADYTEQLRTDLLEYDDQGPMFAWPYFDTYVFSDTPDPHEPPIFTYQYWFTKQTYVNSNLYGIQTTSQAGPPGDIYEEYVHTIIFNDTFDAPFEEYTVV